MGDRIGLMMIGANGSVATTLTTGAFAIRKGLCDPVGMLTPGLVLPPNTLPSVESFEFSGWDLCRDASHAWFAKRRAEVPPEVIDELQQDLETVVVAPGISIGVSTAVATLFGTASTIDRNRGEAAERIEGDIRTFIRSRSLDGAIVVNLASTEPVAEVAEWHDSPAAFERALANNDSRMTAAMIYSYAAIRTGCPVINYTPSSMFEIPALRSLAVQYGVPLAGRDGKTGQTFYKSVIARAFKQRGLTVEGWFSTNILGNDDGQVLNTEENCKAKRQSKLGMLDEILGYSTDHQVHIHYYRPRRRQKEAWDVVDLSGWLGAPVQMRINWIASDSSLAAPMVLDLARLMWWAKQRGRSGVQGFLGAFFKEGLDCPVQNFAEQVQLLERTLGSDLTGPP